ncbi:hypothetical protein SBOR_3832 [Sclerotinia borealis F-4128]|uniref:Phosphoglycerate mutase family protein n=1 Tax=Sclerotinia borealis (strain F-4128) TaxID=1432307 RepID=W9CMV2_SCLBF|nr:hypothetical protein SBOR_3832 [Sclerotinia borealis F-4128]
MNLVSSTSTNSKEVIVHLMRHEQARHKASYMLREDGRSIRDPDLTINGRVDCRHFSQDICWLSQYISHIWCSPMKRTINTALLSFGDAIDRGVKVQTIDVLQNWDSSPNGIGMDKKDLQEHFGGKVNFDKVEEGWNQKSSGRWARENMQWRIPALELALRDLRSVTDRVEVVIVSHGSVLNTLLDLDSRWKSGKIRSYLIDDGESYQRLDKNALKNYRRLHVTDELTKWTSNQDLSLKLGQSKFAAMLNSEVCKHSGTMTIKIKRLNKAITEGTSMNAKGKILETVKQNETSSHALIKLFQEEIPAAEAKGGCAQEIEARVTNASEFTLRTPLKIDIILSISWTDYPMARMLLMKEQMRVKMMIERLMNENSKQALDNNNAKGWVVVVAV